ncbi:carbohydrate ABC transporter permease [Paenibacillus alginolyticus]|uniref:Carbohydrate ABC transporter permease n=1 Tax=Paenibacillus alginolyticus TaxID=59839 RepID=A0ABT4GAH8_9BACL|nr:carbohydrate ABC transporter permease [Paenibacillus alginolyticus]MCY9693182.1 carbohydrate ABC transporter permease [Paenibacillus alginolyticus]MEC0144523.1 carbohydrate ABC transporter permease [Paenibacillus alginolyticus]
MKKNKFGWLDIFIYLVFIIFSLVTLVPFILAIMVSISDERSIVLNGYKFIPDLFSLDAYKIIFQDSIVTNAYKITIIVTIVGTFISLILSSLLGYMMSVQKVKYRNIIALIIFIPIVFSAGLVPWYIVVTNYLHLKNTIWALILPIVINPFNIFLLRNYYKSISPALSESAEIDGAGPWFIFYKIITPLSMPILATVGLFSSLSYWNDFTMSLWLIDDRKLFSVQFLLYRINSMIAYMSQHSNVASARMPSETIVFAMFLITIGPIILVYPYVQKYFVKGIMVGSIKG